MRKPAKMLKGQDRQVSCLLANWTMTAPARTVALNSGGYKATLI